MSWFYFQLLVSFCFIHEALSSSSRRSASNVLKNFTWGVATTAYQIEGAWDADGKGESIWDVFTQYPNLIYKNETGQVADDFYHRYLEDIQLMKKLGIKNSEMSIAWSRLLPSGTIDKPNPKAIKYYNNVFNALIEAGITPWVTLYHWDLPAALNDKTSNGGWLNPDIINKYNDYVEFCFKTFGDRVKHWITFNEIMQIAWPGYGDGSFAPGRCSPDQADWCEKIGGGGNSSTEPYIVAHHALLAHATAVNTYRTKYQPTQHGAIGMTIDCDFGLPFDPNNANDRNATETFMEFNYGWIADPLVFGKYPDIMREYVTDGRLPTFTEAESELIKGSYDFLGLDQYTSTFVQYTGIPGSTWQDDGRFQTSDINVNGEPIGPKTGNDWQYVHPFGMRGLLNWISKRYNDPPIYVFENGVPCPNENNLPRDLALKDVFRINFYKGYIENMLLAVLQDGVDVRGYFAWSLIDNFEWADGYSVRYGLVYIDYANNLTRYPKDSAYFYAALINATFEDGKNLSKQLDSFYPKGAQLLDI